MGEIIRYIKIYILYFKQSVMVFMSHRFNLVMSAVGNFVWTFGQLISMRFLFTKLPEIQGWTFHDLVVLLAFGQCAVYFSFIFFEANLSKVGGKIIKGELDNKLVKPISIMFQLSFEDVLVAQIIPMFITVLPLFIYGFSGISGIEFIDLVLAILVLIIGLIIKYYSLVMVSGLFFWVDRTHVFSIYTETREFNRVPPTLFPKWVENAFTYVIPVLFVSYYPLLVAKGEASILRVLTMESCVLLFMVLFSVIIWRKGLKRYVGTS